MADQKTIVVLGTTGSQGGSVASTFLGLGNWKVRGITRDTASEKARAQAAKGIEMVKADLNDVESLKAAFQGANAIFVVTDFWAGFFNEATAKKAQETGQIINQAAYDVEVTHGLNAAKAASDPSVLKTLERYVFSGLPGVKERSGGKYSEAYHFDSKAAVEKQIKSSFQDLAKITSILYMGIYAENWRALPVFAPQKQEDGSYAFESLESDVPNNKVPYVVAQKDTGVFVDALVNKLPPKIGMLGVSEMISRADYAALWGKVMGEKAFEKKITEKQFCEYIPEIIHEETLDTFRFYGSFGRGGEEYAWSGGEYFKKPWELGVRTTSMEEFIKNEDWSLGKNNFFKDR